MKIVWTLLKFAYGVGVGLCVAEGIDSYCKKRAERKAEQIKDMLHDVRKPAVDSVEDQLDIAIHAREIDEANPVELVDIGHNCKLQVAKPGAS